MSELSQKAAKAEKVAEPIIEHKPSLIDLSIIIVSYNTMDLLRKGLQSIYAHPDEQWQAEIIVVDNASQDGSVEMVRKEFPQVNLIVNQENRGFAAANNQGLQIAQGQYLLLFNSDAEVTDNALWKMVAFLDSQPTAAAVGPQLLYPNGTFQEGAFRFPGLSQIFLDLFPLNWRLLRSRLNGRYPRSYYEGEYPRAFEIDFPLGACLMLRRTALEQVGLLDEAFFMYMEEIDWCYRVKHATPAPGYTPRSVRFRPGRRKLQTWSIYCLPSAKVIHHEGGSSKPFRDELFYQLHKSRLYFYQKHYSSRFVAAARWLTRLGAKYLALRTRWQMWRKQGDNTELTSRLKAYQRVQNLMKQD